MKKFDQINVIPFIDIMLVLLAIVLLTASFTKNGKLDVALPAAKNAETINQKIMPKIITVDANNRLYLEDQAVNLDTISNAMKTWDKSQPVLLKIDKTADFENFVQLSDHLKANELRKVSVLTEGN